MTHSKLQKKSKIQNPNAKYFGLHLKFGMRNFKLNRGFTLIELLISVAIFLLVFTGVAVLISNVISSSSTQAGLLADSDQARKLAFGIVGELRNAQVSSTGAYSLESAGPQSLIFFSNIDGGTDVERVRYFSQNGKLYKGVIKPYGNSMSYSPSREKISVVQNNLANAADPIFYYYDGTYEGVTDNYLAQPVSVTSVKFVKVDLRILNKAGVNNTNFYSITASGAIRNLKTNLAEPGFPDYFYQLTSQVSPGGSGSVAVSPVAAPYAEGTQVNLNAYPSLGYGFSTWTGDVANSTTPATTIVMNSDKTVTANFSILPKTLSGSIINKTGSQNSRSWTVRISNSNAYAVNNVSLYSFSLTQTSGTACSPVVTLPAAFPYVMGNISAGGNRTATVTINFTGCANSTRFTANFSFAGNSGANWGSESINNQAQ